MAKGFVGARRSRPMPALCLAVMTLGILCLDASAQSGEWTWMGGNNMVDPPVVYGTLGQPAAANNPGFTEGESTWTDTSGNFWAFGGGRLRFERLRGLSQRPLGTHSFHPRMGMDGREQYHTE